MSDVSQGPGWWRASDGKWYPPADASQPGPGWWLASDGNWYPPEQRTTPAEVSDPSVRTPVKPVAKPVSPRDVTGAGPTAGRSATAAMGTPAGPAVAPAPSTAAAPSPTPAPAAPIARSAGNGRSPAGPSTAAGPSSTTPATKQATAAPKGPKAKAAAPVPGTGSDADPAVAPAPAPAIAAALSPDAQIRARNEQSRRDAAVLFGARKTAATRALGNISALLEEATADAAAEARLPAPPAAAAPIAAPGRDAAPAPKTRGKLGRVGRSTEPAGTEPLKPATNGAPSAPPAPPPSTDPPLLEVKQGTLAADIEHIGERLVIFNDRVELHDRNDRVRQVIAGGDIADVVVHKKFTGSTVTVEAGTGESIVAKGLKPEQADEIRSVILKRTRAGAPSNPTPAETARPDGPGSGAGRADESVVDARDPKPPGPAERAALLAKLADLHRAGVLTDAELADKQALVENLVRGETLAVAGPSA